MKKNNKTKTQNQIRALIHQIECVCVPRKCKRACASAYAYVFAE
jgi:hypothetical protein